MVMGWDRACRSRCWYHRGRSFLLYEKGRHVIIYAPPLNDKNPQEVASSWGFAFVVASSFRLAFTCIPIIAKTLGKATVCHPSGRIFYADSDPPAPPAALWEESDAAAFFSARRWRRYASTSARASSFMKRVSKWVVSHFLTDETGVFHKSMDLTLIYPASTSTLVLHTAHKLHHLL